METELRERVASLEAQVAADREQLQQQLATKDEQLATKDEQLAAKDAQMKEQLAAKDRQIEELLKRPRTVNNTTNNNNRYLVEQHINVFGKESIDHISDEQLQQLLREPSTAVARLIRLKLQAPENQNVRVPNKRERVVEVVTDEEGHKRWKTVDRDGVLERLWDDNGLLLENEADEEDGGMGARFVRHQERVRESQDQNGRMYREQLGQIHSTLADATRTYRST
ncbi:MAG: hypothetical protein ACPGGE_06245, partial [Poseidonia sp.]